MPYGFANVKQLSCLDLRLHPKKITYDGFGRPIQWHKIDPTKSAGSNGYATKVMTKEYHLMGEGDLVYINKFDVPADANFTASSGNVTPRDPNGYSQTCNTLNSVSSGDYRSASAMLYPPVQNLAGKIIEVTGYIKAEQGRHWSIDLQYGSDPNLFETQAITGSSSWQPFTLKMGNALPANLPSNSVSVTIRLNDQFGTEQTSLSIDELKLYTLNPGAL